MKWWLAGGCSAAVLVVPMYVNWLRHRPHRLEVGTQHIVMAGLLAQMALIVAAALILWLW